MTIQELGSIGEFVAAIATLVTLVYLALQIRHNTRAMKASSHHAITDSFNHLNAIVGSDPKVGGLLRRGQDDLESLTEDEAFSFAFLMLGYMRIFETLYYQKSNGTMEEQLFESEQRSLHDIFSRPGGRAWWRSNVISFSDEFRSHIDTMVREAEDAIAAEFVAEPSRD